MRTTPLETLRGRLSKEQAEEALSRADKFVAATGPLADE